MLGVTRTGAFDLLPYPAISTSSAIRAMVSTAVRGWAPDAVSPESMTASVPSIMALATSEVSALVGRGLTIIDSSICVAVITGLPAMLQAWMIFFWISGTFSAWISTPRSPRATITASVTFRILLKLRNASGFSILATTGMFLPALKIIRLICSTSSWVRTNESAM